MGGGGLHKSPHLPPPHSILSLSKLPANLRPPSPKGVSSSLPPVQLNSLTAFSSFSLPLFFAACQVAGEPLIPSLSLPLFFFQHPPSASLHPHLPVLLLRCWFILMYIYGTELKRLGMKTRERTTPCRGVSLFIHPLPPHFFSVTQTPLLYPRVELLSSKSSPLPSSIPVTPFSTFQPQTGSESAGVPVFCFFFLFCSSAPDGTSVSH